MRKYFFGSLSRCQKRVFEKMCTFCFCLFYVGKRKRENMKKWKKKISKKTQKNSVFWVVVKKNVFFVKLSFFRKIGKHYLCSEGRKSAHFRCNYLFLENVTFFWCPLKVTKHYKNRDFSGHRGKPKMALLVAKVLFWFSIEKGFYYL